MNRPEKKNINWNFLSQKQNVLRFQKLPIVGAGMTHVDIACFRLCLILDICTRLRVIVTAGQFFAERFEGEFPQDAMKLGLLQSVWDSSINT